MKIYIGPYIKWVGAYQIVDKLFFWTDRYATGDIENRWDYALKDKLGPWLANTWVHNFCEWIYDKQKRTVKIKLHKYDTWSMDHTLALIILPMLQKIKDDKHGSPFVEDEDVPEELRSTNAPAKVNEWDTDEYFHKRWEWILDEMIFSFECITTEYPLYGDVSSEEYQQIDNRISNGLKLFGKYYRGLWT
jgi:hypothetical protein